ncbi:MAG: DNA-binding protein [Candidatus Lokiarchaeota archaeon]|nr:DNA-binding protein [Candidatus Lokiarchaeota archaeon]
MNSIETSAERVIIAKLYPDEDIIDSLIKIVKKHNIKSGLINIIGALKKVTLGYFDITQKDYKFETIIDDVELLSCMGNISYKDEDPLIHLHIIVGRNDFSVNGGHLGQPSIISVTGEVYIYETSSKIKRLYNNQFKVSLLNIN